MNKIPVIIDADTGIDDAVAIAVAAYTKNLDVKLITSAAGNTAVENTTKNNLDILYAINKHSIPVAKGSGKNFSAKDLDITAHGKTGLGNYSFPPNPNKPIKEQAVDAIHDVLTQSVVPVTILATGPLSNIAQFLRTYPEDRNKIKEIVISGGLIEQLEDNEAPYLSFNVAEDSIATEDVLNSGVKISIAPSNLGHDAYLTWRDVFRTKHTNKTGAMFEEIFRSYRDRHVKNGIATHDLCALLSISHPVHFVKSKAETTLQYHDGCGYLTFNFNSNNPNSTVVCGMNIKNVKKIYFKTLEKMP